jgi:hypothetical protein
LTALTRKFVDQAIESGAEFDHGDHIARFQAANTALADGAPLDAELVVLVDGAIVGYVTSVDDEEWSILPVARTDTRESSNFRTIEGALEYLTPGVADGLETPALQQ